MRKDDGGQVFPLTGTIQGWHSGISVRDLFALTFALTTKNVQPLGEPETFAESAYRFADAMITERENP